MYKRNIKPKYPAKKEFIFDGKFYKDEYTTAVRAVTWKTAHLDIHQQELKYVKAKIFVLDGVSYNINRKKGSPKFVYEFKSVKKVNSKKELERELKLCY